METITLAFQVCAGMGLAFLATRTAPRPILMLILCCSVAMLISGLTGFAFIFTLFFRAFADRIGEALNRETNPEGTPGRKQ